MKREQIKQDKQTIYGAVIDQLLSELKKRSRNVLIRRFGLDGKKPSVLDAIGKDLGVARERIRQIEFDSFKKLRKVDKSEDFKQIINYAKQQIESLGGFCEKSELKNILKPNLTDLERNQLMFILNSEKSLVFRKGTLKTGGFWFIEGNDVQKEVLKAHGFIVKFLKENNQPVKLADIVAYLKETEVGRFFAGNEGKSRAEMICKISRLIDSNLIKQFGLKNWKTIAERGTREKAYLVLRKHKKPLHFREITNFINDYWKEREALPQTVHNELIKDKNRFVLVGRGIYGLESWGLIPGTVKELIIMYMQKQNAPATREEIVEYVLKNKKVKRATILVTLSNNNCFLKSGKDCFCLNE